MNCITGQCTLKIKNDRYIDDFCTDVILSITVSEDSSIWNLLLAGPGKYKSTRVCTLYHIVAV